jgi:phosphonate transport system ATP-binding protein
MIFQQFNLVPRLDVVSNVLHGTLNKRSTLATMFNLYPQSDIHKAIEILDRLGIAEQAPKRAEALSGGQQQRVAIARALMQDPKIILADEPIASLDPMNAQIVMEALRRIHEEDGRMVIANLHTLDTARRYCDRVIGMRDGRIVFDGTPAQLTTGVARDIYGAGGFFRGRHLHRNRNTGQAGGSRSLRPDSYTPRQCRGPRLSNLHMIKKTLMETTR